MKTYFNDTQREDEENSINIYVNKVSKTVDLSIVLDDEPNKKSDLYIRLNKNESSNLIIELIKALTQLNNLT